jgi:hypothetical protein
MKEEMSKFLLFLVLCQAFSGPSEEPVLLAKIASKSLL